MPRINRGPHIPVGLVLRRARRNANITVIDLSRRLQVHRNTIYRFERSRHAPNMYFLVILAEAIGVEPWRILRAACKLRSRWQADARPKEAA